jgi:hypothetical protein
VACLLALVLLVSALPALLSLPKLLDLSMAPLPAPQPRARQMG